MLRFWIVDNIYERIDKDFSFDSYDNDEMNIGGYYSEGIQDLLKRAICNYHYLFSEEAKAEQSNAYFNIGSPEIAEKIINENVNNDEIINKMFDKYTGPLFIIKDGKGYFTNGNGYSEKYDSYSFGFDLETVRCNREEFINDLNIIPMIEEIKEYYLTHTFEEFEERYPYDYAL